MPDDSDTVAAPNRFLRGPRYSADDIAAALGRPMPTPEQLHVIEAPPVSLLVVAGAGSGKTETMASRVVWLVANGYVTPESVLGLTFTRKAAGELSARIGGRLRALRRAGLWGAGAVGDDGVPLDEGSPVVSTYHAYAGRLVEEYGLLLGVEPDARLLTEAAAWQVAHEVVTSYDGPMDAVGYAESTVTKAVTELAGELAEHLRTIEELSAFYEEMEAFVQGLPQGSSRAKTLPLQTRSLLELLRARRQMLPMVAEFAQLKRRRDSVDFADQIALAARLAREFPHVAKGERARHRVVLLDEFQDTSEAQVVLLSALFADAGGGPPVPVIAVGDPHQSIYGWRGASATTLTRFAREFGTDGSGTPVLPLSVSWRNDQRLLDVANAAAAPLSAVSTVPVRRLVAAPSAGDGSVLAARLPTVLDEASYVAARIGEAWFGPGRRHTGITAAVLCRRRAQFPALIEALRARDLPVEVVGLGGLLTTPEVADVVALLTVAQDPERGDHLMRLLSGPANRLGAADLDALGAWSRALHRRHEPIGPGREGGRETASLVEALDELPPPDWIGPEGEHLGEPARRRLRSLGAAVAQLRTLTGLPLADLVGEAERLLGLDVEILARPDLPAEGARVHLDAFADAAASFQAGADRPTLGAFLAWLEAAAEEERGLQTPPADVSGTAVQVLTVHAAKGLEWDVVAVPGLIEGAFPALASAKSSYDASTGQWRLPPERDKGWCTGLGSLPFELRGDAEGLPPLRWRSVGDATELDKALKEMFDAGGAYGVQEERRLAYVAFTRARHQAILTASVWAEPTTPRVTSRFLVEVVESGRASLGPWEPMPIPDEEGSVEHPGAGTELTETWPHDPMAHRRALLAEGVELVAAEAALLAEDGLLGPGRVHHEIERAAAAGDRTDRELLVLLAERESHRRRAERPPVVDLPTHLSTSAMVALHDDEEEFAARLRRPMPQPPARQARAGTAFHAWVEEHYQCAAILDIGELPGGADDDEAIDIAAAKERFLASEWADRLPVDVELAVETIVAGIAVRGRIDAVFEAPATEAGGARHVGPGKPLRFVVVDWKTGRPPSGRRARSRAVQLALYRLAYARLQGLDPEEVTGAFYYASTGQTIYPQLPSEAEIAALINGA